MDGYGLKPYAFPKGPCGPIHQTESRVPKIKPSFTGKPPELDRGASKGYPPKVCGYGLRPTPKDRAFGQHQTRLKVLRPARCALSSHEGQSSQTRLKEKIERTGPVGRTAWNKDSAD